MLESITVLIVDDHPMYRSGLAQPLSELARNTRIVETESISSALNLIEVNLFDLILFDWSLLDGRVHGLNALVQTSSSTPIVVISGVTANESIGIAQAIGARGFIPKSANGIEIVTTLSKVLSGATVFPQAFDVSCAPVSQPVPAPADEGQLTTRQGEVLQLICRGFSNKQIAADLNIAERTVRAHVSDILRFFRANSRTEVMVAAQRFGWVTQ